MILVIYGVIGSGGEPNIQMKPNFYLFPIEKNSIGHIHKYFLNSNEYGTKRVKNKNVLFMKQLKMMPNFRWWSFIFFNKMSVVCPRENNSIRILHRVNLKTVAKLIEIWREQFFVRILKVISK